jgi:hypothetical protein
MKRFLRLAIGLFSVIGFTSSAEAINIDVAEVQNGGAFVQGGKAVANATITWEGGNVTTANKNGGFKFSGVVPADCVGTLSDGKTTIEVVVLDCTPVSAAPAPVPKTGQTTSYAAGDDGALQKGVAWPTPRFTHNGDGTITDNLTRLTWLKDWSCLGGAQTWANALAAANTLADGNAACSLTDGSVAGDWRLPNHNELMSLLDLGTFEPALPSGNPFANVQFQTTFYWSSTTYANRSYAWTVNFSDGFPVLGDKTAGCFNTVCYVTAVRGGS